MAPAGSAWTERERIAYLFCLLENTGGKLDYNATPLPNGRSLIACQRMVDRLKDQYKAEIAAIKNGDPMPGAAPATEGEGEGTPAKPTPKRGRKAAAKEDGDQEGTPTKRPRGRPSKKKAVDQAPAEEASEVVVKEEVAKEEVAEEEVVKEEPDDVDAEGEVL
ncbi:hypothetical protein BDV96DRAFT_508118 [Lophiotrema nucula]|uniref:Uncharacterized protein n=1 Tax=Lophiotrema nucula TaxID=690887 RepID=A0A6A5YIY2_9PLEO|nr:hypothetical protein BDV96DRAFT_508118 [Lophiotrema nucula]